MSNCPLSPFRSRGDWDWPDQFLGSLVSFLISRYTERVIRDRNGDRTSVSSSAWNKLGCQEDFQLEITRQLYYGPCLLLHVALPSFNHLCWNTTCQVFSFRPHLFWLKEKKVIKKYSSAISKNAAKGTVTSGFEFFFMSSLFLLERRKNPQQT